MSVMNQKPSEAGWFYHAPSKKTAQTEPVGAPPASQIPGLGEVGVLPREQPKEMVFRDTDSKYIRLAKMGGRKDLLVIRPNSGTKREPKAYPRSEWFYLEDNAQQDRAGKQSTSQEPWKFLLPEYMVYQSMGETTLPEDQQTSPRKGVPMRPAPFALDQQKAHVARGGKATTQRSPRVKGQGNEAQMAQTSPRPTVKEDPTDMAKILSYSYQREWHAKHRAEEEKQARNQKKGSLIINKTLELSKADAKTPPATARSTGREQNPDANNNQVSTSRQSEKDKKEPFKLSKFKKVPSRLDTRRSTEILKAKGK